MIDLVIISDSKYGIKEKVKVAKWSDIILEPKYLNIRDRANELFLIADRYGLACPYLEVHDNGIKLTWKTTNIFTIYIDEKITYDFIEKRGLPMTMENATILIKYIATVLYPPEAVNVRSNTIKRS